MNYVLAIDQGTSSTRAMLYTREGKLVHGVQFPITQHYPQHGWVEHAGEEIWSKTLKAIRDVVQSVPVEQIKACGITNQRETTLVWDKRSGQCIYPAIVWQDRRTEEACQKLQGEGAFIQAKTGLLPDAYFSASKLRWLLEHIPDALSLANKGHLAFGTIDSFLIWRLTGGRSHVTDITNASRTMLYNIHTQEWDEELLNLFAIPYSILPKVLHCDGSFGEVEPSIINKPIPITGVAGDQQAALIGQQCFKPGMVKATFGTGGFILANIGEKPVTSSHQLLTTIAYKFDNQLAYGLEGGIYQAGTTVKWLRDQLKIIETASETETLARQLKSNEGVYFVPAFTGLGAPHWLPTKGGIISGLSSDSGRAHLVRAALESVCYQARDVLDCMQQDIEMDLSVLRVDGGMAVNNWFLQFLSTQCNLLVQRPADIESTAFGAAMIATIGYEGIDSLKALQQYERIEKAFTPSKDQSQRQADYEGWLSALSTLIAANKPGSLD